MDFSNMSDDDFCDHKRLVLDESERRENLKSIPGQIKALADAYRMGGGEEVKLANAISPEEETSLDIEL